MFQLEKELITRTVFAVEAMALEIEECQSVMEC
jgi:hypothetical protein